MKSSILVSISPDECCAKAFGFDSAGVEASGCLGTDARGYSHIGQAIVDLDLADIVAIQSARFAREGPHYVAGPYFVLTAS